MVNSWSLLYDELMSQEHSKYWYDYDRNDPDRKNPFAKEDDGRDEDGRYPADHPSQEFWYEDGISLTGNPAPSAQDTSPEGSPASLDAAGFPPSTSQQNCSSPPKSR